MERVHLTRAKYEDLLKKLAKLKKVDRRMIAKEIGIARDKGDLRENAEYDAAKEKQGLIEKEIFQLEDKLSRAEIIDNLKMDTSKINIGATVHLKNVKTKDKIIYSLVGPEESDFSQNKISVASPVGKGLLGHKKKDIVKIQVPSGILEYEILKFEYLQ